MKTDHNIRMTSAETGNLWTQYMADSMAVCVLKYFLEKMEDLEIAPVVGRSLEQSQKRLNIMRELFRRVRYPIPVGFTDDDVDVSAPRLFSDSYALFYAWNMARLGMRKAVCAFGLSTRSDVSDFFKEVVVSSTEQYDMAQKVLLSKGLYVRPPSISTPDKVSFVHKQSFLHKFRGEHRPLHAMEITHLFHNTSNNALGRALTLGFAQVARSDDVVNFMLRGKEIASKHMEVFSSLLDKEDLPAPMTWDASISDSTTPPFSDKLMMFHTLAITAAGLENYGMAIAASQRSDLGVTFSRLMTETALYGEDGTNIMIDHEWMEEQPQAENRRVLALQ